MNADPVALPGSSRRARLISRLQQPVPLEARPFAAMALGLGLTEDEVIEGIHDLLGQGVVSHFGPLFDTAPLAQAFDETLRAATESGLPLLPRPYEAVGAMLGVSEARVLARLAALLSEGRILRVVAVLEQARHGAMPGGQLPE